MSTTSVPSTNPERPVTAVTSKGATQRAVRRAAVVITSLILSVLGTVALAPAAFAMRVIPPSGDQGAPTTIYSVTKAGMAGWEIALIALGSALAATALTAVIVRFRVRSSLTPVAS